MFKPLIRVTKSCPVLPVLPILTTGVSKASFGNYIFDYPNPLT